MAEKKKTTPEQRLATVKRKIRWIRYAAVAALLFILGIYLFRFHGGLSTEISNFGQAGDFVGGFLNPLFAMGALFALLYTIVLQVEELQEMRQEFSKTVDAAKQQTFEATFFQLLRLHNDNLEKIELSEDGVDKATGRHRRTTYKGRAALYQFVRLLEIRIAEGPKIEDLNPPKRSAVDKIQIGFDAFYDQFRPDLGNYFVTISEILSFVDHSELNIDKKSYGRLFRTQLASWEALLIAYYSLADQMLSPTMSGHVVRYGLLAYLDTGDFHKVDQLEVFDERAFLPYPERL